jgi:hypothetical protein
VVSTGGGGGGAGLSTVIVTEADLPPIVAVSVVLPSAIAVTRPVASMVATTGDDDVQLTGRPVRAFPAASRGVAVTARFPAGTTTTELIASEMLASGPGPGDAVS